MITFRHSEGPFEKRQHEGLTSIASKDGFVCNMDGLNTYKEDCDADFIVSAYDNEILLAATTMCNCKVMLVDHDWLLFVPSDEGGFYTYEIDKAENGMPKLTDEARTLLVFKCGIHYE